MITLNNLTVNDVYQLDDEDSILVSPRDDISLVIKNFSRHGELRGIFVIEDDGRFLGVISRIDLFDWARVKIGTFLVKPLVDSDKTIRLINLINATTVGDILRPETKKANVLVNDTLAHALSVMIETDLIILPVVDESRHIIGSLTLSELLNMVMISENANS